MLYYDIFIHMYHYTFFIFASPPAIPCPISFWKVYCVACLETWQEEPYSLL